MKKIDSTFESIKDKVYEGSINCLFWMVVLFLLFAVLFIFNILIIIIRV